MNGRLCPRPSVPPREPLFPSPGSRAGVSSVLGNFFLDLLLWEHTTTHQTARCGWKCRQCRSSGLCGHGARLEGNGSWVPLASAGSGAGRVGTPGADLGAWARLGRYLGPAPPRPSSASLAAARASGLPGRRVSKLQVSSNLSQSASGGGSRGGRWAGGRERRAAVVPQAGASSRPGTAPVPAQGQAGAGGPGAGAASAPSGRPGDRQGGEMPGGGSGPGRGP